MNAEAVAVFQSFSRPCMPFDVYHEAMETALARPVMSIEFDDADKLRSELLRGRPAPTTHELRALIPAANLGALSP